MTMKDTLIERIEHEADKPSLYPEKARKSRAVRIKELKTWYECYGEINESYTFHGLDLEGVDPNEYLDRGVFRKIRYEVNSSFYPAGSDYPYNYTIAMRDKGIFEAFVAWALRDSNKYIKSLGLIDSNGFVACDSDCKEEHSFKRFVNCHDGQEFIFKKTFGYAGEGVVYASIDGGHVYSNGVCYKEPGLFIDKLQQKNVMWLVQPYIKQHSFMAKLNETSVNTLRFITFNTGVDVYTNGRSIIRYGQPGARVDNTGAGGGIVGVDEDGVIGHSSFNYSLMKRFPCPVAGETVPYYKEALSLARYLHGLIPQLFTIGWDFAITPTGPLVIEGNDGWDPNSIQTPLGYGMRAEWDARMLERKKYYSDC